MTRSPPTPEDALRAHYELKAGRPLPGEKLQEYLEERAEAAFNKGVEEERAQAKEPAKK